MKRLIEWVQMCSRARNGRFTLVATCITFVVLLFAFCSFVASYTVWEGGFPQAEFQLKFRDYNGKPLTGVTLHVEDSLGRPSYGYPIDDYMPDNVPTSDVDGVLVFHHIGRGAEYHGRTYRIFFMEFGSRDPPAYICRFFKGNHEIHNLPYSALMEAWMEGEMVARTWKWPDVWPESVPEKARLGAREKEETIVFPVIKKELRVPLGIDNGEIPSPKGQR